MASMLTTIDNPHNPFEEFDDWYSFDSAKGYHSCAYVARVCDVLPINPFETEERLIERAIDIIVEQNITGLYKKVQI